MVLAEAMGLDEETAAEIIEWHWIAVETDAPHMCGVYRASRGDLLDWMGKARDALETIRKYRNGDRSGYNRQGATIVVPSYLE